jgi:GMP synthase (glutamine-hydrolysing)
MIVIIDNVLEPAYTCLTDEIASHFTDVQVTNMPRGEEVPPITADIDGALITGSSAGVYEASERPWIDAEKDVVQDLIEHEIPTLGICFGHQIINAALGGTVEHKSLMAGLVEADLDDDPLFDGVESVVPVLHGDHVTTIGDPMERIGTAPHCQIFATKHQSAPVWTVQYHPELTPEIATDRVEPDFGWEPHGLSYADSTAIRTLTNFRRLITEEEEGGEEEEFR